MDTVEYYGGLYPDPPENSSPAFSPPASAASARTCPPRSVRKVPAGNDRFAANCH